MYWEYVRKESKLSNYLSFNMPKSFLSISPRDNEFYLHNREYFNKTKELTERYKELFKEEVTIKTNYSK